MFSTAVVVENVPVFVVPPLFKLPGTEKIPVYIVVSKLPINC